MSSSLDKFRLPPVIECSQCDSFESSQSTAETTLIPSSSFSSETSPSSALRQRGTPTQCWELPTIVEKGARRRRLQPPTELILQDGRNKWMILAWTLVFILAIGLVGYGLPSSKKVLQVEPLPAEMKRQLTQAKIAHHPPGSSFTIRLKGSRLGLVRKAVDRYSRCPSVQEIQIDWRGSTAAPSTSYFSSKKVVPLESKTLKSVLLLDETVTLSCEDIKRGFLEWRKDPTRPVGFFPLLQYTSKYSLLSDRALFVHKIYLTRTVTSSFHHACQEWVLSAWISAMSEKHPIAMAWKSSKAMTYSSDPTCLSLISNSLNVPNLPSTDTIYVGASK
eukprot:scaffold2072_cov162-Amphora_coffeaeformis.AAC.16